MIQFNLLPDIKIQYLKAKRQKQLVMLASIITVSISIAALVLLIVVVFGVQKKSIADLSSDIKANSTQLKSTQNLNKILTVQNQLNSLPSLHDGKAVVPRLFTFIEQVTPTAASINSLNADFAQHTMVVTGTADTLATVNTFTDGLKFATYHTAAAPKAELPAFSSVVLSNFGRDNKDASYTITLSFAAPLFSEVSDTILTVPNINTHGNSQAATDLFKKADTGQ